MKDCHIAGASPAKDNIVLIVRKRPSPNAKGNIASPPYDFIFQRAISDLNNQLDSYPLTVIYCKSMQWIGYGYEMARQLLGDNFYAGEKTPQNARVLKKSIHSSLQKPEEDCSIRLIISSVALGIGADLTHVKRVIHAGPPTTMETYVQEIGRSGRAGTSAQAILYYNNTDLAVQQMRKEMKDYCQGDTCHRELINEYFGFKTINKPTECCSKCQPELGLEWDFDNLSI
ncbi:WRN-like protein [Mya arenaria]|uniref:DNA 3'-5' helicase n=1 Tax=Mya arenaria TaxID=6604 RepID=A0ABY7ETL4_MYAAR|nr:WRN-like protein [Mya arenaria]